MKIYTQECKPQAFPFAVGEEGRGRWLEQVQVSHHPGQEPVGEEVEYVRFGQDQQHCLLTRATGKQVGLLLRICTNGGYSRGAEGAVFLKGGEATRLVSGRFAWGDAGCIGGGTDDLWHVSAPAIFFVRFTGGGHCYLLIPADFRPRAYTRTQLCQALATDDDPEVAVLCERYKDALHRDIASALALAARLEEQDAPLAVQHFIEGEQTLSDVLAKCGIAVPAVFGDTIGGVAGVQGSTLLPGTEALLFLAIGPGGGRRYGYKLVAEQGVARLHTEPNGKASQEQVLAVVGVTWSVAWLEFKDGNILALVIADQNGIHHRHQYIDHQHWTEAWPSRPIVTPPEEAWAIFEGLTSSART